jgi:hypothetical protein
MTSEDPDIPAPARIAPIQWYNHTLDAWTWFDVGHMVTLHEHNTGILFVRDARIRECVDFDWHLCRLTCPVSPNLMTDLASEHKYVHAVSLVRNSHTPSLPPMVLSGKEYGVPNDLPAQPIKWRFSSVLSLTDDDTVHTAKRHHSPLPYILPHHK